jgi:hypothetical protein
VGAAPFARRARSKIPQTWQNARSLFLHDLSVALSGSSADASRQNGAGASPEFLQRIAGIQTDLKYPPLFPLALQWDKYLPAWLELDWKARRRLLTREILPDLRAWCAPWAPSTPEQLDPMAPQSVRAAAVEQSAQYNRVARLVKSLPDMLTNETTPRFVAEKIAEHGWQLSQLPILITTGRITLDDIREGERQAFAEIADLLNLRD